MIQVGPNDLEPAWGKFGGLNIGPESSQRAWCRLLPVACSVIDFCQARWNNSVPTFASIIAQIWIVAQGRLAVCWQKSTVKLAPWFRLLPGSFLGLCFIQEAMGGLGRTPKKCAGKVDFDV